MIVVILSDARNFICFLSYSFKTNIGLSLQLIIANSHDLNIYCFCSLSLTQTLNLTFLQVTVSTLKPTVGIVLTDWPSLSLYKIVVFPAASKPSIRIRISLLPNTEKRIYYLVKDIPFLAYFQVANLRAKYYNLLLKS